MHVSPTRHQPGGPVRGPPEKGGFWKRRHNPGRGLAWRFVIRIFFFCFIFCSPMSPSTLGWHFQVTHRQAWALACLLLTAFVSRACSVLLAGNVARSSSLLLWGKERTRPSREAPSVLPQHVAGHRKRILRTIPKDLSLLLFLSPPSDAPERQSLRPQGWGTGCCVGTACCVGITSAVHRTAPPC